MFSKETDLNLARWSLICVLAGIVLILAKAPAWLTVSLFASVIVMDLLLIVIEARTKRMGKGEIARLGSGLMLGVAMLILILHGPIIAVIALDAAWLGLAFLSHRQRRKA